MQLHYFNQVVARLRAERPHVTGVEPIGSGSVRVSFRSPDGAESTLDVSYAGILAFVVERKFVQDAFPTLSDAERELFLTGMTDAEWEETFPPEEFVRRGLLTEISPKHFVVEASEAGLAPGEWPDSIGVVDESTGERVVERFDYALRMIGLGSEFRGVAYTNEAGRRLDVLND